MARRPEIVDDLKHARHAPEVARETFREANDKLESRVGTSRTAQNFLDWRTLLVAAVAALVLALVVRLFTGPGLAFLFFLVAFGAGWYLLARRRKPPFAKREPVVAEQADAERA